MENIKKDKNIKPKNKGIYPLRYKLKIGDVVNIKCINKKATIREVFKNINMYEVIRYDEMFGCTFKVYKEDIELI